MKQCPWKKFRFFFLILRLFSLSSDQWGRSNVLPSHYRPKLARFVEKFYSNSKHDYWLGTLIDLIRTPDNLIFIFIFLQKSKSFQEYNCKYRVLLFNLFCNNLNWPVFNLGLLTWTFSNSNNEVIFTFLHLIW